MSIEGPPPKPDLQNREDVLLQVLEGTYMYHPDADDPKNRTDPIPYDNGQSAMVLLQQCYVKDAKGRDTHNPIEVLDLIGKMLEKEIAPEQNENLTETEKTKAKQEKLQNAIYTLQLMMRINGGPYA